MPQQITPLTTLKLQQLVLHPLLFIKAKRHARKAQLGSDLSPTEPSIQAALLSVQLADFPLYL